MSVNEGNLVSGVEKNSAMSSERIATNTIRQTEILASPDSCGTDTLSLSLSKSCIHTQIACTCIFIKTRRA